MTSPSAQKAIPMTPAQKAAAEIRQTNRWKAGMLVTNPFGKRVWLKDCLSREGEKIGITDCCSADEPCEKHKTLGSKL